MKAYRWGSIVVASALLAACGSSTAAPGTATPASTPTSSASSTSSASGSSSSGSSSSGSSSTRTTESTTSSSEKSSTSRSTESSSSSSSASTSEGQLAPVTIGQTSTYSFTGNLFSIDVPVAWTLADKSTAGEALVLWTDPTGNALLVVDLVDRDPMTRDQLVSMLTDFLNQQYSSDPDFTIDAPVDESDGSVLVAWSISSSATNGAKATLVGNSFIEQTGKRVSILTTLVPDEQFDSLSTDVNGILNSYSFSDTAALP